MNRQICIHHLGNGEIASIPGFAIAARTHTLQELRNAVGTLDIGALLLDLDQPDAVQSLVTALELRPRLPAIGVTGKTDLAPVLVAQRAGCSQIVTRPINLDDLLAVLQQSLGPEDELTARSETLAILGAIGGAGSTTLACHLAEELAQVTGNSTAVFDLDLEFGGVAAAFDLSSSFTIADLASAGAVDRSILESVAIKVPSGVHVFDRPRKLGEVGAIDELAIKMTLQVASQHYPFVVLDLPRRMDAIIGFAVEQCSKFMLVTQLTVPSIKNTHRIIEAMTAHGVPDESIEVVINRYSKGVHTLTVEAVQKQLGRKMLGLVPSDFQAVHKALDLGSPLGKRNPVRSAIREIAIRLAGREAAQKPKGWLSKLAFSQSS